MDSIEHGTYLDEETAEMMAHYGTALVLTQGVAKPDPAKIPPNAQEEAKRLEPIFDMLTERTRQAIAIARAKGVFVGCGTDAGGNSLAPHDFSTVTHNNARILRWDKEIGTLEAGKLADFVVLGANPLDNISNVRAVEVVYKGGQHV
jgi:imidazolonepropionase-like amidohydrolase